MTRIQIDLPDATAQAAQEADALLSIADRVAAVGIPPMSMEEINAEVKAACAGGSWQSRSWMRRRNAKYCSCSMPSSSTGS